MDVDIKVLFEAIKNMSRHSLSIYDSIHVACALLNDCESIVSFDKDLDGLQIPRDEQ